MSQFIVIGSGPGGSATALRLLESGHRVLMLERGTYLPKEAANQESQAVYGDKKYRSNERWYDGLESKTFQPWMHYHVGGNAKLYGAALYRFRPGDFDEINYPDGVSPAWPIDYAELEKYYDEAEALYTVHGNRHEDATEPSKTPFPYPKLDDESFVAQLKKDLQIATHSPPLGISLEKQNDWELRLDKFDAYPDPSLSKSDPESRLLPRLKRFGDQFELRTNTQVEQLEFDRLGEVTAALTVDGESLKADCYILAAGAINSARILLASGLGAESPLIGANYMAHLSSTGICVFDKEVDLSFAKTFATNEWYQPDADNPVLLGSIQTQGKWDSTQYRLEEWTRKLGTPDSLALTSMEFFFMSEDLPLLENRISLDQGQLTIKRKLTNERPHQKLINYFHGTLSQTPHYKDFASTMMPIDWCTHQCGTLVFGENATRSVLDEYCRLRSSSNLFVTDSSCFPSSSALNPTLTIVANALRVGNYLAK